MKKCTICKIKKEIQNFYTTNGHYQGPCKECSSKLAKLKYKFRKRNVQMVKETVV